MPSNGCEQNVCTYGVKSFVFLCGGAGILFSILAANSCEFISFIDTDGNPPDKAEHPPFDTALAGSIGIFGYIITDVYNEMGPATDGCVSYEYMFAQQTEYPSLATAQFCALISPILAGIAIFANLVDCCVCNFVGSYMIGSLLFLVASGLSAGTFTLLADPAFCLEDAELQCSVENGVYYSIGSTILYFISSLFLFCAPQADPFCNNFGRKERPARKKSKPEDVEEPILVQSSGRTPTERKKSKPEVVEEPILVQSSDRTPTERKKSKTKVAAEKAATKAAANAEKERVKEEKLAAKEAAKKEKEAASAAAVLAASAAAVLAASAAVVAAASATASAAAVATPAAPVGNVDITPVTESDGGSAVATIDDSSDADESSAVATTEETKSGGIKIVPAAAVVVSVGGGAYAFKMVRDKSAAAEEERQRQFKMLMGGDVDDSSDTGGASADNTLSDMMYEYENETEIDDDDEDETPAPELVVDTPAPKKKKRRGLKSVFGKKTNGREVNIDKLVAPDAKASEFSKTLAKILTFGAPGRFPDVTSLPGSMPMDSFDVDMASSILTDAQTAAGISKEESAEIFANVVNCMLIDIVDLASTSLKEKDEKVTSDALGIVITFMDLAASLYTSIADGVDIVPVTYGGDISKNKLEQMYSTFAVSGMTDMGSMDEKFDDRVSLLQDVFQINPKKAEGLMMKAMQKNMMDMMKSGKMPDGMEDMMQGMGDMGGMGGMPGMEEGEEPDPEQLKEMLRALKDLKDSGSLPESELAEVKKQFKEAFGSTIDDVMSGANESGEELGAQDKELLDLMKDILD